MLRCGGFEWPWVRDSLAYGGRVVCLSRVVDYSGLVMHGRNPLYNKLVQYLITGLTN